MTATSLLFKIVLLVLFSSKFNEVQSFNILSVFFSAFRSNFFVFEPFLKELAIRGHNVTVISFFPQKKLVKNYQDIDLSNGIPTSNFGLPMDKSLLFILLSITVGHANDVPQFCEYMLENENVQNLWKTEEKFDLVITEQYNSDCALALAHRLGTPVIGVTSHMVFPWHYNRYGIPYNPSYAMFDFLEGGTKPTFIQRVIRSYLYHLVNIVYSYITQRLEQNIIDNYFENTPPLEDLASDIKLVLVYQNFILTGSSILPPNVIEVGGYHVATPKPLSGDLLKFIEESQHGVIYISFGSMLEASSMELEKIMSILMALDELPQRVVWKWDKKALPGNPKNIYLSKWLPQNDILAHPKVLAFFSHCGLLGTTEAMFHGVPVIGLPVFGDQPTNAAAIEESGLGVQVSLDLLNKDELLEKFRTVLKPEFRDKVKSLSAAWHDRPIRAMDSAVFWTEYAVKYQNISLRPPTVHVPLYQYLCLDIILVLSVVAILSLILILSFIYALKKLINNVIGAHGKKLKTK